METAESRDTTEHAHDDRGEAVFWYLRLLIENKVKERVQPAEISRRTGITKAQLSQIQSGRPGGGILSLIRFSALTGMSPGENLNRALDWWEREGRDYKIRALRELAQAAVAKTEKSARVSLRHGSRARAGFEHDVSHELGKSRRPRGPRNTGE